MFLNNLYNFKNPIKHFINIDNIKLPDNITKKDIQYFSWTMPFGFRIRKQDDKYRMLKIPNILNFVRAYEQFKSYQCFNSIKNMDIEYKRLSANLKTGDFEEGEYDLQLERDFERLCIYDNMIKLDIKEYYGRIYTHNLELDSDERFICNMNEGATNGLIMGNYLSLYLAEKNLTKISNDLKKALQDQKIDCEFSYFSDDFFFFCNQNDNNQIIKIFDKVLEQYSLERNDAKKEIWTYEKFNNYNLVARYWKKLIAHCNLRFRPDIDNNKMYFINQLIYRMSKLTDDKLKKVFINNFFKTKYFRTLEFNKFQIKDYDYHQLCFILKFCPEALLYSIDKFIQFPKFDKNRVKQFFKVRYTEALNQSFNDEQLYYYYAIKLLNFKDIICESKNLVINSSNQVLISYYLKDKIFDKGDINLLKQKDDEEYWFQNYHLILYSQDLQADLHKSINKYLIPKQALKEKQVELYREFYINNIQHKNSIIRDIIEVTEEIDEYLQIKMQENKDKFEIQN